MAERVDGRSRTVDTAASPASSRALRGWAIAAFALMVPEAIAVIVLEPAGGPGWLVVTAFACVGASCLIVAALVLLDARRRRQNPVLAMGRAVWAVIRWVFRMVP